MNKLVFSIVAIVLIVFACTDRDDELLGANIRINNRSTINFSSVQVRVDTLLFQNIPADAFSEYLEFETAFAADTITVVTDSTEFVFTPDSTGVALPIGLYTYELNFSEAGELQLNFRVD